MAVDWDFFKKKVQKGLPHGQFLSGRATVIGAGPPNLLSFTLGTPSATATGSALSAEDDVVFLIGLNQQMTVAQASQVQRFFEIGSARQYFITGHTLTTIQMNRILYHGPNLLRAFYAYYKSNSGTADIEPLLPRYGKPGEEVAVIGTNKHRVQVPAGSGSFFINLASDLFSQPIGLLLILRDQDELTYGMAYAEHCYIDNYVMATDSTSILMTETANIQAERIVPLPTGTIDLVDDFNSINMQTAEDSGDILFTTKTPQSGGTTGT